MPQMADITVKKADGTTNVVYSAATPSAGDKSPAVWVNESVGAVLASRPKFTLVAMDNGTKRSRRLRSSFVWPKTRIDSNGNVIVSGGASSESSHLVPQDMTLNEIDEYVAQFSGLLHSALVRNSIKTGYAPG